jgi:hypothetical protein
MDALFDHLEVAREAVSILNGKHTHWVGRGQPEECAERFLQQVGRSHAYASVFADDLASNSESFAELLALESPRVVWMADQVRAGYRARARHRPGPRGPPPAGSGLGRPAATAHPFFAWGRNLYEVRRCRKWIPPPPTPPRAHPCRWPTIAPRHMTQSWRRWGSKPTPAASLKWRTLRSSLSVLTYQAAGAVRPGAPADHRHHVVSPAAGRWLAVSVRAFRRPGAAAGAAGARSGRNHGSADGGSGKLLGPNSQSTSASRGKIAPTSWCCAANIRARPGRSCRSIRHAMGPWRP